MTRLMRQLTPFALLATLAGLAACSPGPNPNAKKVVAACLAISGAEASAVIGDTLGAFRMTGDDAPRAICEYNNAKGDTAALLQLQKADGIKDTAADLAADEQQIHTLFKADIKPPITHPADGFGGGAFYVNMMPRPDATVVQLHLTQNGWKVVVVVNNPKDFPSGEKQAAALAQKALDNIQSGAAYTSL